MQKNVGSQKVALLAIDVSTNAPKTGDAANLTAYVSKDWGAVTVLGDTSATEMDATNAPGMYVFDLTQSETNADELQFSGKSSTANVKLIPRIIQTVPANFSTLTIANSCVDADLERIAGSAVSTTTAQLGVNVVQISADSGAADNCEAFFDGTGYAGTGNTIPTVTNVTNLHASAATAAELAKVPKSDSNVTWNATALASIQSEAQDALQAYNLDHLFGAVDTNWSTTVHVDSALGHLAETANGGFDRSTDSQEAIRDNMGTAQTGDGYAIVNSGTHGNAALKTLIDTIDTVVDAILADTGTDGVVISSTTANAIADALLDRSNGIESSITPRQAIRAAAAILAGIISGAGTGTEVFKGIGQASGGTTRVTVTVDSSGNRSALTLNL